MESHPYTKPRGVGPVTTQLTPGADPASWKSAGTPAAWSCSPTCRAWSESSMPSFTDSTNQRVRAVLAARTIRVWAVLAARAIRVRALLGARAIRVRALLGARAIRVRALLGARAIRVRALLGARAIRVRALLGARAIIVGPHPPSFLHKQLDVARVALPDRWPRRHAKICHAWRPNR